MKVTFLGTGEGFGTPTRGNVGFLLPDEGILIDAPPDVLQKLQRMRYPLERLEYVLLTHIHADHSFGVLYLALYSKHVLHKKYKIIAGKGVGEALSTGYKLFWSSKGSEPHIELLEIDAGEHDFSNFRLVCSKVKHPKECLAFRIEVKGKSVVFSGDTFDDLSDFAKGADLFIGDSTFFDDSASAEESGHGTALRTIDIGKKAGAKIVAVSHLSVDTENHISEIKAYAKKAGVRLVIPADFETIEV